MDGGKFKMKLSEVNTRAVSRKQNELVNKIKMVAGDKVSIRGEVMEYMYTTGQKFETTYIKEGKWNKTQNTKQEV